LKKKKSQPFCIICTAAAAAHIWENVCVYTRGIDGLNRERASFFSLFKTAHRERERESIADAC
jgi:hypothetical protein